MIAKFSNKLSSRKNGAMYDAKEIFNSYYSYR